MCVQRTRTKQLHAPLTTLRHPKSMQCNFNSWSFNYKSDSTNSKVYLANCSTACHVTSSLFLMSWSKILFCPLIFVHLVFSPAMNPQYSSACQVDFTASMSEQDPWWVRSTFLKWFTLDLLQKLSIQMIFLRSWWIVTKQENIHMMIHHTYIYHQDWLGRVTL